MVTERARLGSAARGDQIYPLLCGCLRHAKAVGPTTGVNFDADRLHGLNREVLQIRRDDAVGVSCQRRREPVDGVRVRQTKAARKCLPSCLRDFPVGNG